MVIPTLNESLNLIHVLPHLPAWIHELIIVDGRSNDDTVEVARRLWPDVVVVFEERPGKGAALRAGFTAATGDIVVTLDADGSMSPDEISTFVGALMSGADYVKGSRFIQGAGTGDMGVLRRSGNLGLTLLVRAGFGGRFSDLCYGYNAFWRSTLPALDLDGDGFEIETLMNIRAITAGLRVAEIPSFEAPRVHGQSNLRTFADGWRVLRTILREWRSASSRPTRRALPRTAAEPVIDLREHAASAPLAPTPEPDVALDQ
ncbi:MAG: glycosyltransferase family 2 protein [Acidimicrobiales bacterium]|nr:glycosyltransferase family 2 protein [Acidimicrobiales bacterium]